MQRIGGVLVLRVREALGFWGFGTMGSRGAGGKERIAGGLTIFFGFNDIGVGFTFSGESKCAADWRGLGAACR